MPDPTRRARLFGTDGVRGLANGDLTAELALDLSVAAAHVLGDAGAFARATGRSPSSAGTPAPPASPRGRRVRRPGQRRRRRLRRRRGADPGRRLPDRRLRRRPRRDDLRQSTTRCPTTGIKFFARGGVQARRRARGRDRGPHAASRGRGPSGAAVGRVRAARRGRASATSTTCSPRCRVPLDGLHVVVDCAHGAASRRRRPRRYRRAGAAVIAIGAEPDGLNINDGCGSTHLEQLRQGRRRARRRPGHRPRRRRRPVPRASTPTARSSTATRSWRSSRWRCAMPARWSATRWSRPS